MKRVSSQLIFCSPSNILRNCVLEQDEHGVLTQIIDLQTQQTETYQTLFCDGIITNRIVSLKMELNDIELDKLKLRYNYFDFSENIHFKLDREKPLLLDFGTNNIDNINQLMKKHSKLFAGIDVFQLLTACCFLPLQILDRPEFVKLNHKPQLMLFKGINLIDKQITPDTTVESL